jgi:type II secretion system protein J
MNTKLSKNGFTLVEILVSMAIMLTVISIVYGSYFAASTSAQTCKAKLNLLQDLRIVLDRMSRQISSVYAGPVAETSQEKNSLPENSFSYFKSSPSYSNGELLHLVAARSFFPQQKTACSEYCRTTDGLFDVAYRFDRTGRTLLLSQEPFIGTKQNIDTQKHWQPLLDNVESIELEFFDGKQWLRTWDFDDAAALPLAAKIRITCENENRQKFSCSAAAYIPCSRDKTAKSDLAH